MHLTSISFVFVVLSSVLLETHLAASSHLQNRQRRGGGRPTAATSLVQRFDADKNGRLDTAERAKAREFYKGQAATDLRRRSIQRMFGGQRAKPPAPVPEAEKIRPDSVPAFVGRPLYDPEVLRTVFLDFGGDDWFQELADFHGSDVEVPANLVVDGNTVPGVGVRFRGSSSYYMAADTVKKPFNVSINHTDKTARVAGVRTLNLLNGNQDPSFVRDAMFSHVARRYIAVPRVSYVRLVINGGDWGIYQNVEQFNKDFLKAAYGTRDGVRWRIVRNTRGSGALLYLGDEPSRYWAYDLKTKENPAADAAALQRLIHLCKVLDEVELAKLPEVLPPLLDIDEALWYCALENAFLPSDGYMNQGYDYRLYEDKSGQFHMVSHDNNEILQPPGFRRSRGASLDASPLFGAENSQRPVISVLLAVPQWRARYLAHLRHIAVRWLDWQALGPVCHKIHNLIGDRVAKDAGALFDPATFRASLESEAGRQMSLKTLIETRRQAILSHAVMQGPWPEIGAVSARRQVGGTDIATNGKAKGKRRVVATARVGGRAQVSHALFHYRAGSKGLFRAVPMFDDGAHGDGAAGDGVYGVTTPDLPAKGKIRYYVEIRSKSGTAFAPEAAAARPARVR